MNKTEGRWMPSLLFAGTILYFTGMWIAIHYYHYTNALLFWAGAMVPLLFGYRTLSAALETSVIPFVWFILAGSVTLDGTIWYLPLIAAVLVMVSYPLRSRWVALMVVTAVLPWVDVHRLIDTRQFGMVEAFFLSATIVGLGWHVWEHFKPGLACTPKKIDLILCSHTGNTAHYAQNFIDGARQTGAEVIVHRFHRYKNFAPVLTGDALVCAFPVSGWKPPWPLINYLITKLPSGNGKPVFILYTAAGGPENAGVLVWILLTLKGYRVAGRLWGTYPVNVPTLRPGPAALYRFLDRLVPWKRDIGMAYRTGEEFARGNQAGLPFVLWPTPLVLIGYLLDNQWLNGILYRVYAWRRRCVGCGLCVRYCPVERLAMINGIPKAKGTCSLCFSCVNLCPQQAMQMLFWSEYGQPYRPRWPHLLEKFDVTTKGEQWRITGI